MEALRQLLADSIDYAGLFPPAGLDMQQALDNYREYRQGPHAWMLGRFVLPLSRLNEFTASRQSGGSTFPVSLLLPAPDAPDNTFQRGAEQVCRINEAPDDFGCCVKSVEVRCSDPAAVPELQHLPANVLSFVECPADSPDDLLAAVAAIGRPSSVFAKIRTGGVTPDAIPGTTQVAAFLCQCRRHEIGLKATAGLHHPFRDSFPLTYAADSPVATMHGFLNVFAGACLLAEHDLPEAVLTEVLEAGPEDGWKFQADRIAWRDFEVDTAAIADTRRRFLLSFGSCSFSEPIDDLRPLGMLPENTHATD